jgi:RNA polymerase primary sigma factor
VASAGADPVKPTPSPVHSEQEGELGDTARDEGEFDDDMEVSLSLAAMEAELKPKVLQTFDNVADAYKRLRRLQDQDIELKLNNTSLSPAQERRYKKLKNYIIAEVKSLRLKQVRINWLVEQIQTSINGWSVTRGN